MHVGIQRHIQNNVRFEEARCGVAVNISSRFRRGCIGSSTRPGRNAARFARASRPTPRVGPSRRSRSSAASRLPSDPRNSVRSGLRRGQNWLDTSLSVTTVRYSGRLRRRGDERNSRALRRPVGLEPGAQQRNNRGHLRRRVSDLWPHRKDYADPATAARDLAGEVYKFVVPAGPIALIEDQDTRNFV